jgi:hypothetical protein
VTAVAWFKKHKPPEAPRDERILCTLWVERETSVARIAHLTGGDREATYQAVYRLCSAGLIEHPAQGAYRLTETGRARVGMILDLHCAGEEEFMTTRTIDTRIDTVIRFGSGAVMVIDGDGREVPEYRGPFDQVKEKVLAAAPADARFYAGSGARHKVLFIVGRDKWGSD